VGFWVLLAGLGFLLMLGRYTVLFDAMHRIPIVGSGRIPVRYHLWVALAVSALAAVGADRLARPGRVRLGAAWGTVLALALASLPILIYVYAPVWTQPNRWTLPEHRDRYRWLGEELLTAGVRTGVLLLVLVFVTSWARRAALPRRRAAIAALLPLLAIADLMGAHWYDVPTVAPSYWTEPPESVRWLRADPRLIRIFGAATFASGEPGYASEPGRIDFFAVRDPLAWSLPIVWGLDSTVGETPILPSRRLRYSDTPDFARFDVEGLSHILTGRPGRSPLGEPVRVGSAYIFRNPGALPRARLLGRPVYVRDDRQADQALKDLGPAIRDRIVVEDPDQPLPPDAVVSGSARIVREVPERVEIETTSSTPAYLFLADTYDPGWSATLDGRPVPVRPALVAFRAVFVPAGRHTVVFSYRPAGFQLGLLITIVGAILGLVLLAWPGQVAALGPTHGDSGWPRGWVRWEPALMVLVLAASAIGRESAGTLGVHPRWSGSFHRFTWGAGIEAMKPRKPLD
ncbi:MAG: YfhO family protein, partial [Isosphaeraceae bacterium]|nr:YfhO family protein [Isosphaeraceae bacterium]